MIVKEEVVDLLLDQAIAATRRERRMLRRYPFFRPADIVLDGTTRSVICRDVSRLGMGLLDTERIEPGVVFTAEVPIASCHLRLDCESRWCSQIGDDCYLTGVGFCDVAIGSALSLLSEVIREEINRRVQQRFPFFRPMTIRGGGEAEQAVFCRDISRGGMGMVHKRPLTTGRAVACIPDEQGQDQEVSIDVRWCMPAGQNWYLSGGKFASVWLEEVPAKFM